MTRKTIAIRQTIATALALLGLLFVVGKCTIGCKTLTPEEEAKVAGDGVKLSMCATQAHFCKLDAERADASFEPCWDRYVVCKEVHGFDGGAK